MTIAPVQFEKPPRHYPTPSAKCADLCVHVIGLTAALIGGAVLFGIGWGLVGFCPGPALAALGTGETKAFAFLAAMAAGMWLFGRIARR